MLSTISPRVYRPRPAVLGIRQQISTLFRSTVSRKPLKQVGVVLLTGIVFLITADYLLDIRFSHNTERLQQLQAIQDQLEDKNIQLLATRAGLMSKARIKKIVAKKHQLFEPAENQIHNL